MTKRTEIQYLTLAFVALIGFWGYSSFVWAGNLEPSAGAGLDNENP